MNIGDYVRTKYGIGKIIKCNSIYFILDTDKDNIAHEQDEIIKSSPNIIDLIEVGDYVNESKVIDISTLGKDKEKWVWVEQMEDTDNKYGDDYVGYNNEQIKSIVTKEMFANAEYRVETN